jgi:hypothetical protein
MPVVTILQLVCPGIKLIYLPLLQKINFPFPLQETIWLRNTVSIYAGPPVFKSMKPKLALVEDWQFCSF